MSVPATQDLIEQRAAAIVRDATKAGTAAAGVISVLLVASVWGNWRAMVLALLTQIGAGVWNPLILRQSTRPGQFSRAEWIRMVGNLVLSLAAGHVTHWTLPNFLWLPVAAILEEGRSVRSMVRPTTIILVTSAVAVAEGTPIVIPICFTALSVIAYLFTRARKNVIFQMMSVDEVQKSELRQMNHELRDLPRRIQTSILPKQPTAGSISVAARMVPAEDVGGDYYEVLPLADGAWIAIGDVSGHGLDAGLVMFMLQSAVASLTTAMPDAKPSALVGALNEVLYHNIRDRLDRDEHVTFTLMRQFDDGRILFAGAHECILIRRSGTGRCEVIETTGTWLGIIPDVRGVTDDCEARLEPGDLMVLYTDGLTESRNESSEMFGLDRVCREIEAVGDRPPRDACESLLASAGKWSRRQDDDISVVAIRFRGREAVAPFDAPGPPRTTD